jgi:hypothetical protein
VWFGVGHVEDFDVVVAQEISQTLGSQDEVNLSSKFAPYGWIGKETIVSSVKWDSVRSRVRYRTLFD